MDNKLIGNEKNILFYNDKEGNTKVEVLLENEDVWLNADALSTLFNIDRSGIVRHINNIYKDEELDENSTCAKIAHLGNDGKQVYNTKYYNLQVVDKVKLLLTTFLFGKKCDIMNVRVIIHSQQMHCQYSLFFINLL